MYARTSRIALALRSSSRIHKGSPSFCPPLRYSPSSRAPISTYISPSLPSPSPKTPTPTPTPTLLLFQHRQHNRRLPLMSFFSRLFSSSTPADNMAAAQKTQQLIDDNAVVVFSKSYCPYCRNSKRTLDDLGAKYYAIELDQEGMSPPCCVSTLLSPRTIVQE